MVQSSATVHFDKADPIVFYYEPFQYNYEEGITAQNLFDFDALKGDAGTEDRRGGDIFSDTLAELKIDPGSREQEKGSQKLSDSTNLQKDEDVEAIEIDTPVDIPGDLDLDAGHSGAGADPGSEQVLNGPKPDQIPAESDTSADSEPRVTNATYFYRILHHLIDVSCDGSRFKCCNRTPATACDSCKVIEKLLLTYLDLTTLEDIIADRSQRGICGHLYCQNPVTKSGSKSKYKIDVISKNIYKREEYESFCSVLCLEENEKVHKAVSESPVETGTFTPRAMRCADNETLRALHDNLFSLPLCSATQSPDLAGSNNIGSHIKLDRQQQGQLGMAQQHEATMDPSQETRPSQSERSQPVSRPERAADRKRIDTFEIYEDFESCDSRSDSSLSEANVTFNRDTDAPVSIYKPPDSRNGASAAEKRVNGTSGVADTMDPKCLGIFSLLWYLLSNLVTNNTRDLVNSGVIQKFEFEEQFQPLYNCCLKDVPSTLLPTIGMHIKHILSTFNHVKDNLLNDKVLEPLSLFIKYIVLVNRYHLPFSYSRSSSVDMTPSVGLGELELGMDLERFESMNADWNDLNEPTQADYELFLVQVEDSLGRYQLDRESIDILIELFVQV